MKRFKEEQWGMHRNIRREDRWYRGLEMHAGKRTKVDEQVKRERAFTKDGTHTPSNLKPNSQYEVPAIPFLPSNDRSTLIRHSNSYTITNVKGIPENNELNSIGNFKF